MGLGDGQDESGEGGSQAASTGSRKLIDLRDCLSDSPRFRCASNTALDAAVDALCLFGARCVLCTRTAS